MLNIRNLIFWFKVEHRSVFTSFLSSRIIPSSLIDSFPLPSSITIYAQAEYNLHFAPRSNPLVVNNDSKSLNLMQAFLIFGKFMSVAPPSGSYCTTKVTNKTFLTCTNPTFTLNTLLQYSIVYL